MKRTGLTLLSVAAAALMIVLLPAGGAIAGKHHHGNHHHRHDKKHKGGKKNKGKTYKSIVGDDYFSPTTLKIHVGDKVNWKWKDASDSHNVTLTKGPVKKKDYKKKFTSATGSYGIKFKPTFKKKGTYTFICTIHPTTMQETVKVKK